jgi:imidazole glycerol-phosphate synthase subunit HisF
MLKVRIIPLLLLKGASLVKSVGFTDHRVVGDAVSAIKVFSQRFADEMVILDLDAAERGTVNHSLLSRISEFCNMPVAFGGGVNTLEKADILFRSGADKIVVNSVFFTDLDVVRAVINKYGSQSIILSIDVALENGDYSVYYNNGNIRLLDKGLIATILLAEQVGVGEILINDITRDGMMNGFDLELLQKSRSLVTVPLIIAGGCASKEDFKNAFNLGADAVSAGSVFHWVGESIIGIKNYLDEQNINVRKI